MPLQEVVERVAEVVGAVEHVERIGAVDHRVGRDVEAGAEARHATGADVVEITEEVDLVEDASEVVRRSPSFGLRRHGAEGTAGPPSVTGVLLVGLTGGIGSGKSTVSALLAERGAVIIDADAIVRELQRPGTDVFDAMVERFGPDIVAADGTLDRAAVAATVFTDEQARKDLEGIVHPAVGAEMLRRMQEHFETDHVVVYDVPLLVESGKTGYGAVVVVDVDPDVAVQRLVEHRGMDEVDARNRIANQVPREQRLTVADRVIDNSGSREALAAQVDEAWKWLVEQEREVGIDEVDHPR